jgi:hypothetical protein
MMGRLNHDQRQLFYSFRLEDAVPDDHLVRAIAGAGAPPPRAGYPECCANLGRRCTRHADNSQSTFLEALEHFLSPNKIQALIFEAKLSLSMKIRFRLRASLKSLS